METTLARRSGLLRVLVVEDNEDNVATLLRLYGHDVQIATDGWAAVQAVQQDQPDVVLLDMGLPGFQVARLISVQNHRKPPLLVALTDDREAGDRGRAAEAGIHLLLVKPVDSTWLEDFLEQFSEGRLPA